MTAYVYTREDSLEMPGYQVVRIYSSATGEPVAITQTEPGGLGAEAMARDCLSLLLGIPEGEVVLSERTEKSSEVEVLRARVELLEHIVIEMCSKWDNDQRDCYIQEPRYRAWIKRIRALRD